MKATFDLPEALVRKIKLRAVRKGQKLKDAVAELLRRGLEVSEKQDPLSRPRVESDPKTGLPYIDCPHGASPAEEMTSERVAELLLQQEMAWHHEAS